MKTKINIRILLLLLIMIMGVIKLYAINVLYERGTAGHEWTASNLSEFTTTNCNLTLESYGIQISTSNTTAYATKTISPQTGATLNIEAEWWGMSNTGRAFSFGSASFFRFGNIYILENDQDQTSAYSLTAFNASNYTTFNGQTGFRAYDVATRPYYVIRMEINTQTNTLNFLRVYSSSNLWTALLNIENQTLTSYDYSTIEFGYIKAASMSTTQVEILKSIKVTETPQIEWSAANASVSLTSVGTNIFNKINGLPSIINNGYAGTISYSSDNEDVAIVNSSTGEVILIGTGTANIIASGTGIGSVSYVLTVTGSNAPTSTYSYINSGLTTKTWALTGEGVMPRGGVADLGAITMSYGVATEMGVAVNDGGTYVMKVIDGNGWSQAAVDNTTHLPNNPSFGGTYYTFMPVTNGTLTINGKFNRPRLYNSDGTSIVYNDNNVTSISADLVANNIYYFYCEPYDLALLNSFSYTYSAYLAQSYGSVSSSATSYTLPSVEGMNNPYYTVLATEGEMRQSDLSISGNIITGFNGKPGAIKIKISEGGTEFYYYLTVAYPATEYPGHQWNFWTDVDAEGNEVQRVLDVSDNLKTASTAGTTVYDSYGEEWVFVSGSRSHWFRTKAVAGDNAFCVKETNGLVFNAGERNFFLRSDAAEYTHIGIRGNGSSFTIPALAAGDIVEIMWRHENSNSGTKFAATNLTDLRGKDVDKEFLITESAQRGDSKTRFVGYYSFIAKGGDVTFTLRDNGNCDIQSIRIYKGPYRPTMRDINLSNNIPAPTTMLLDNAQQELTYNYCNQLYSTATGPAMYVLKGYRQDTGGTLGVDYDHEGCVTGSNASKTPVSYTDKEAYPVSDDEKVRLYELRKNIVGLEMFNSTWQSSNNSYNNGVIRAKSGWGKITIRMNNYTNDMEYVIGYTPDYTLTIGSAPHQTYPYTWDFTKIAGQKVTGRSDNVLYSIEAEGSNDKFSGAAPTNWYKNANGQYMLNTDNSEALGSQYVPGAVLVTQDRALSNFNGVEYDAKWAKDELDGLGFDGGITMHIDHLPTASEWDRASVEDQWNSLLSFKIVDAATFVPAEGTTPEEHDGTWSYSKDLQTAGSGQIQLNHDDGSNHIDESSIPIDGIGFRLDDGDSKYIRVVPSSLLQAGDVISVTAYNAYSNRDAGISFNKSALKTDVAKSMNLNGRLIEETLNYTVTTNDGLDGRPDFYLYRHDNTVHITAIEISRKASTIPNLDWCIYTLTNTTITVPDLNADGKQDWIYVSASAEPESVTNATKVTEGTDGPDANAEVHKYKVTDAGNALLTFAAGTKIYKIGVTHILKDIHQVGNTGWATEIRKEDEHIDHELIGYFTKNDVNAYTVKYDSYDLNTATIALTPINEDGYVPGRTGIVMKLDNAAGLSSANAGKNVPLFYPSYTRPASSTPVDFPTNNLMYQDNSGIDQDNRNFYETYTVGDVDYTKFILTNVHWTYQMSHTLNTDESAAYKEADAAGFYRLHIWSTTDEGDKAAKNTMPAHSAYLLVPTSNLPLAVWSQQNVAAARRNTIAIRTLWGEDATAIEDVEIEGHDGHSSAIEDCEGVWYTLSGMRQQSKPTVSGVYIHDGKKVVISPRVR